MKTHESTIHVYDYGKKKQKHHKTKTKISNILKIVIPLLILVIAAFCIYKYSNKNKIEEIDKKIAMSIELMQNIIKEENFTGDYLLVTFPDDTKVVSNKGYIINNIGASYKEFEAGYIMLYKNCNYKFELQDSGYCATKDVYDKTYQLLIFKKCSSKEVDYLKK
jgi:hypothetical protein